MTFLALPAPAKLNLFLHITHQRNDGYHEIQTLFQLIDYNDQLTFRLNTDPTIRMITHHINLPDANNLILHAAQLLQQKSQCQLGCDIALNKKIPMGAGLGGGSSDAATTLIALNKLWKLHYDQPQLCELGRQLGADVPLFIHGYSAWGEGLGDDLTAAILPKRWYCLLLPNIQIETKRCYQHPTLNRQTPKIDRHYFSLDTGHNDFEPVVIELYPQIATLLTKARQYAPTYLTGTGAALFARFDNEDDAILMATRMSSHVNTHVCQGLNHSPVHNQLSN